jgi:hypothetical protein
METGSGREQDGYAWHGNDGLAPCAVLLSQDS